MSCMNKNWDARRLQVAVVAIGAPQQQSNGEGTADISGSPPPGSQRTSRVIKMFGEAGWAEPVTKPAVRTTTRRPQVKYTANLSPKYNMPRQAACLAYYPNGSCNQHSVTFKVITCVTNIQFFSH